MDTFAFWGVLKDLDFGPSFNRCFSFDPTKGPFWDYASWLLWVGLATNFHGPALASFGLPPKNKTSLNSQIR